MLKLITSISLVLASQLAFAGDILTAPPADALTVALEKAANEDKPSGDPLFSKNAETAPPQGRSASFSRARLDAFTQHGFTNGLATGRYDRFVAIRRTLDQYKSLFTRIYKVDHLYTEGGLLQPGVALASTNLFQRDEAGTKMENSQVRYQLVAQPQLVTQPMDWYTFLVSDSDLNAQIEPDNPQLRPENAAEQTAIDNAFKNGYNEGLAQADMEFDGRVASLTSIVEGMHTYAALIQRGLLNSPTVVRGQIPISGNESLLTLSTNSLVLASMASFQQDPKQYKALMLINGTVNTNKKR